MNMYSSGNEAMAAHSTVSTIVVTMAVRPSKNTCISTATTATGTR